jgi:hypothetical protein
MSALALRMSPARLLFWPAVVVALVLAAASTGIAVPVLPIFALLGLAALLAAPPPTSPRA